MQKKINIFLVEPFKIFGVPYRLFVLSCVIWFGLFCVCIFLFKVNPLYFFLYFGLTHLFFVSFPLSHYLDFVLKYNRIRQHHYIETDIPFEKLDKDGSTLYLKGNGMCRIYALQNFTTITEKQQLDVWQNWFEKSLILSKHKCAYAQLLTWRQKDGLTFSNEVFLILSIQKSNTPKNDLQQLCYETETMLSVFQPIILSEKSSISPLTIYAGITSPLDTLYTFDSGNKSVAEQLSTNEISFSQNHSICFQQFQTKRFLSSLCLKQGSDIIDTQMISQLQNINAECMFLRNIQVLNKNKSISFLTAKHRFDLNELLKKSNKYIGLNSLINEGRLITQMGLIVYVWGDTFEEITKIENQIEKICQQYQFQVTKNTNTDIAAYFSLFPVNNHYPHKLNYLSDGASLICLLK